MKNKIFILTISYLVLIIVLFSCKKKNTITDNNPPNKPSTPYFTTETNLIGDNITFKVTAIDPDEDSVDARFNWGDGDTSGWCDFITSGDTVIGKHCYRSIGTFYVKAQVKDNHEETSDWSEPDSIVIQDSAWTLVWTCVTPSSPWLERNNHTAVVFDNKMWIIGGYNHYYHYYDVGDVWYSADGVNWICATDSPGWIGREAHTSVVFDNKMWLIGGWWDDKAKNDVWCSSDGVNWICATESAGWSPRDYHTSVVFDNKMWVIGGWNGHGFYNDVWYSSDGINWSQATPSAAWSARESHASTVFDNRIWVCGGVNAIGNALADVWHSPNGRVWTCATDSAWPPRYALESVTLFNTIWILGNDIWYLLNNKKDWICITDSLPWQVRSLPAWVVFDNKIWLIGGRFGILYKNDVWSGEIVHGE